MTLNILRRGVQIPLAYPSFSDNPFNQVCRSIIMELEKRGWKVPGFHVEFDDYSETRNYRHVSKISIWLSNGMRFQFKFGRRQCGDTVNSFSNFAGVSTVCANDLVLHYPWGHNLMHIELYKYVGDNLFRDCEWFFNGHKSNAKLLKEPRRYLLYSGSFDPYKWVEKRGLLPPYLRWCGDYREYEPIIENGDTPFYHTEDVIQEMVTMLRELVLAEITSAEIPFVLKKKFEELTPAEKVIAVIGVVRAVKLEIALGLADVSFSEMPDEEVEIINELFRIHGRYKVHHLARQEQLIDWDNVKDVVNDRITELLA